MRMSFIAKDRFGYRREMGWLPEHHPTFDPGHGYVVAHDVLEHNPKDPDSIQTELMAIGAGAYVKELNNRSDWVDAIGNDSYSFSQGEEIPEPPIADTELGIRAQKLFNFAWNAFKYGSSFGDHPVPTVDLERRVRGWWTAGYFASKKRYEGISQQELLNAHNFIKTAADNMREFAHTGERLLVTVNKVQEHGQNVLKVGMKHVGREGNVLSKASYPANLTEQK